MKAIVVKNLNKSYGSNHVIKGISFDVEQGEIFALLGTNGAGKTTTLSCLEGILQHDGEISVQGEIGIQLQSSSLPRHIKAMEAVRLFAKWNHVKVDTDYLARLGITEFGDNQYKQLSTGQKRRLHLGLAMLSNPDIIFLDEPTAGLDVEGRIALHDEIRRIKASGKTVIMASHDMAEVDQLCDRIAILKDGKLAFCGSTKELTEMVGENHTIHIETTQGTYDFTTSDITTTLLQQLSQYQRDNIAVRDIKIERASLEQRFMEIAKEEA